MKKTVFAVLALFSISSFAASPEFQNLSEEDVENVSKEFGANFSHTTVSAPETEGIWGIEVGVVGGSSNSPELKDVINQASPGDGDDFDKIYHAAVMARAHFPLDLFAEVSVLPEREISDVTVSNGTLGLGWNAGSFFSLPLDIAVGVNVSNSEVSFEQDQIGAQMAVNSKITLNTKTRVVWIGISKEFSFVTPYLKLGRVKVGSDVDLDTTATSTIFTGTSAQSMSVSNDGGYAALGVNIQIFFLRLGIEGSQVADVKKGSAKLSFAF